MMSLPLDLSVLEAPPETEVNAPETQIPSLGLSRPTLPHPRDVKNTDATKALNPHNNAIHLWNANLTFTPAAKDWQLSQEERELVSASISQTWTDQAMKCYMCAADCANCDIHKGQYSFVCKMAKVVPVLLESLGQPDPHRLKRIFPQGYPHSAY